MPHKQLAGLGEEASIIFDHQTPQECPNLPPSPWSAAYRTVALCLWQDAYKHLDTVGFLQDDFCTPLGVYVTSLLHG